VRRRFPLRAISFEVPTDERTRRKAITFEFTVEGTGSGTSFRIHIESADRALLNINNQLVFEGSAVETVKFLSRLLALTKL